MELKEKVHVEIVKTLFSYTLLKSIGQKKHGEENEIGMQMCN